MTLNLDQTSVVTSENRLLIYCFCNLVIWVCLSDILFTITRQAVGSRNTSTCHVTNGHGICWRQRGCGGGFSHVNARPQTVGRTKKLFRNVTCLFRCCLMSVSMVALSSERMFNKHQVQTCTLRHCFLLLPAFCLPFY